MATSTQETQELVSPDSEELLVAPELLASYSSSSDEAAATAKGKSTGKPAMEFTPESELNALELDDAPESEELLALDSLPPASETTVPNSLPPGAFLCPRCHLVHEERESWNRAHSLWKTRPVLSLPL